MPNAKAHEVLDMLSTLRSERANFEHTLQLIADNILGYRDFEVERNPGLTRNTLIYDNTPAMSLRRLADALDSILTNRSTRWHGLATKNKKLMELDGAREALGQMEDIVVSEFDRPAARFTPQMHEAYIDMVSFGNCCPYVESDDGDGVFFSTRPMKEMYFVENSRGQVKEVFREFELTNKQALEKFPDAPLVKIRQKASGEPFERSTFIHWVYPNLDQIEGNLDESGMAFVSQYISEDEGEIIKEEGYHEMPYMPARWIVDAGNTYGIGIGNFMLPDAKTLNVMVKTILRAGIKAVDPPLLVQNDSIVGNVKTGPNTLTVYNPTGIDQVPIREFANGGRIDIGIELIERQRDQIRTTAMFELLQLASKKNMTATEVQELSDTMRQHFSPISGRLEVELLSPLVNRVVGILARQGKFDHIQFPEEFYDEDGFGAEIEVEYISPVAVAQKRGRAQGIVNTLTIAANLAQVFPEGLDNFDVDYALREYSASNGNPAEMLRLKALVAQIREQRAQQQAEQQQREQAMQAAQAGGDLVKNTASLRQ